MGYRVLLYKILALFFLISVKSAIAANAPESLHFIGRYRFEWNGIPLGSVVLNIEETADSYSVRNQVASQGIINLFTRHSSDTTVTGKRAGNTYLPQHYESYYKTKNKPRHIRLVFDAKGAITEELNEPPENRKIRPEVPHALKDGAYDPLTLLMAIRAGNQKPRGFDAKRLFEVKVVKGEKGKRRVYRDIYPVQPYALSRIPLAGLTDKEKKEFEQGEPQLMLYLSDDQRRIPLAVSVPAYFGQVRGALVRECATWEECKL